MPRINNIQVRRDTAANWTSVNPTLAAGEIGFETDTSKFKIGTGAAAWTALAYSNGGGAIPQSQVTNLTSDLAAKAPLASPVFTGTVTGAPAIPTNATAASAIGYIGMPQTILASGNLTLSAAHAGDHVYVTGTSQTITIPANGSVPFEIGTTIVIVNANVTSSIAITTDTLRLAGTSTTGTRTLAAYGMATLVKVASTTWYISGNGVS